MMGHMHHHPPGRVRFTYLHGAETFIDLQDTVDDAPTPAALMSAAVPAELQARIEAWDDHMGDAFDYTHGGEGRPPESWPSTLRDSLTREYDALLADLHAAGLPAVRDAWWALDST
ncbi:hypothetical protein HMPREF2863_00535 [Micrococcus sp. HMSC067E09]|nr:hypothetical protein HMPREF2863_00535 [Micrococcus sp. HMSC067E09]